MFYGFSTLPAWDPIYTAQSNCCSSLSYGYYGSYIMEQAASLTHSRPWFLPGGGGGGDGRGRLPPVRTPSFCFHALVGLVLAGAALAVYRHRSLETAGDVVSVRWVRPVFKYGVAFCVAVTLGQFLYFLFGSVLPGESGPCCASFS